MLNKEILANSTVAVDTIRSKLNRISDVSYEIEQQLGMLEVAICGKAKCPEVPSNEKNPVDDLESRIAILYSRWSMVRDRLQNMLERI